MRKIRIMGHVSLDGVVAPPGDSDFARGEWSAPYRSAAGAAALAEAQGTSFDLLLGSRTYDQWADFWPKIKGGPFADGLNAAMKYGDAPAGEPGMGSGWGLGHGCHGGDLPHQVNGRP